MSLSSNKCILGLVLFLGFHGVLSFDGCNLDACNSRRYALSLRLALSQYGIPLAILPSLQLIIDRHCRLQVPPSLQMQRTCKYTSEGFCVLYMLEHGFPTFERNRSDRQIAARFLTYQQDKLAEIKQLFHDGTVSHLDVDPSGATWLEASLYVLYIALLVEGSLTSDRNCY
jgi:hypothetical protein